MSFRAILKVVLLGSIAFAPLAARAQQTGASISGSVADPDGALIPGATVTLTPAHGKALTTQSTSEGTYVLHNVPAGAYSVTVTMQGFATYVKQGLHLTAGQNLSLDIKMVIQAQQEVQVTTQTAQVSVDPDSNASSTVIKGKDLEALSDDPDELSSELSALAGPSAGPNGGQIYVDGFTGGQLPPKSSIREIRINQNPFSAQYDRLGYGRVEVFTKPGTDKFHGFFSAQGGMKAFNTSNPFLGAANSQPDYHTVFMFGNFSGPLNHMASFTVGGSHRSINNNSIINPGGYYAKSATDTTPCQPGDQTCTYFSSYPEANRAVLQPDSRTDLSPRIDLALSEKNTLTARYQFNTSSSTNSGIGGSNLPSMGTNSDFTAHTIQISDTQIVSPRIINETRFEYEHDRSTSNPIATGATLSVQGAFTWGGSSGGPDTTTSSHFEVQNYTSIALQKNFIRLGGRLRSDSDSVISNDGVNGNFTYAYLLDPCVSTNTDTNSQGGCVDKTQTTPCLAKNAGVSSYQCGTPSQYSATKINKPKVNGRVTDIGLYAETDWKVRPNLTISYGLRYEAQNVINSHHDIAPRVSFAWGVPRGQGRNPTTVVRGGYGIFYDRFGLGNYLNTLQNNGTNRIVSTYISPGKACTPLHPENCGTAVSPRVKITQLGTGIRSPYTLQAAIGVDQQLGRLGKVSVNYLNARGVHQFMTRDFYDSTPGATTPYDFQYQSAGIFRENQLMVNSNIQLNRVTMFGFYSLSFANANTFGSGFVPTSNTNTRADYGRASFARRQFGVIGGNLQLPYAFTASPFIIVQGGAPYNLLTGTDPLGSSVYNLRPWFAQGDSGNCRDRAAFTSSDTDPVTGDSLNLTAVPINYCTSSANATVNMRISRVFGFGERTGAAARQGGPGGPGGPGGGRHEGGGRGFGGGRGGFGGSSGHKYNFTLGAQISNLFNMVPYGTPTAWLSSSRFGQFTSLAGRPFASGTAVRTIMLQGSFNF
ncbi:carboxypeptidase-like regulatory domain-containing protein [Edaphobacter sp.]|uniref:TonB-dependent receptor n=1 Tax=Edaphobacter sp. TaxID=1934404 RepID=UPI002DB7EE65|nr:carboxypeptidase-like regulatory domain-containing protein [Edaphobacter sp.]HEU5340668.1 carboxypeptidase-like regulatory domain-containing protein [Edaphobacter sp.]